MTNPSYTDERVRVLAENFAKMYGENVRSVIDSLLTDRQRLQAEVEAYRADAERMEFNWDEFWNRISQSFGSKDVDEVYACYEAAARATPNETKEAKS